MSVKCVVSVVIFYVVGVSFVKAASRTLEVASRRAMTLTNANLKPQIHFTFIAPQDAKAHVMYTYLYDSGHGVFVCVSVWVCLCVLRFVFVCMRSVCARLFTVVMNTNFRLGLVARMRRVHLHLCAGNTNTNANTCAITAALGNLAPFTNNSPQGTRNNVFMMCVVWSAHCAWPDGHGRMLLCG